MVAALAGVARADNDDGADDDEDGDFVPMPKRSIALAFGGHATRIGGLPEAGVGPTLELALGRGRWQYFIDGGFTSASVTTSRTSPAETVDGHMTHAGGGLRWLARQFRPGSGGGVELFLVARGAYQHFSLDDGTWLGRPELDAGFGVQGRLYKRPRFAFRLDARVLFTPSTGDDAAIVCRGRCMAGAGASTGFSTGVGIAW
jgi:hypothetical protein